MPAPNTVVIEPQHTERLDAAVDKAPTDQYVLPLLVASELLPQEFDGGSIIPAVYYGRDPHRTGEGFVDVLPGDPKKFQDSIKEEPAYWSPHNDLRREAERIASKGNNRKHRGDFFQYPGYVVRVGDTRFLFTERFTEINFSTKEEVDKKPDRHSEGVLKAIAEAYDLGTIAVGGVVEYGKEVQLPKRGVPAITREIGQTILRLPYEPSVKVEIVKSVEKKLEQNFSPDYRPWLKKKR